MLEKLKQKRHGLLLILFSVIIFIFHIWYIRESYVPVIRNDEYGYWSHAALFTGHDWSDVLSHHMSWYSYGYSLILTPLFLFSHDIHLMYRAAIILNGIFGVLTFVICIRCAKILFPKFSRGVLLTVSFMVCMYSSYITQSQVAWSETFLYLMVWLLLYVFLLFENRPTVGHALLLSTLMGGCYITHNRTIGIVTAYFLVALLLRLTGAVDRKLFLALLVPLLIILFINVDIKTYLCMTEGYGLKPKNGMGGQKEHFLSLLTVNGWKNLARSFSGQVWCLLTSTFGLVFFGFIRCAKQLLFAYQKKKAGCHTVFYLFTLLASLGSFAVSAISLIDPASITDLKSDTDLSYFIYTRYDECIVGILLLLGFFELAACRKNARFLGTLLSGVGIYAVMSIILYFNLRRIEDTWHYRSFCVAGIGFYRLFSKDFAMRWCILIAGAVFLLLVLLLTFYRERFRALHITAACLLLVAVYIPTGLYSSVIGTLASQRGKVKCGNLAMYDELKKYVGEREVYCTLDNTKNFRIAYELQVNLIDTHVHSVTPEDVPADKNGYFICCSAGDMSKFDGGDYYMLTQSDAYAIVIKGEELAAEIAPLTDRKLVNLDVLP